MHVLLIMLQCQSVLVVVGQCNQNGNIVIWDTMRPINAGPVARLSYQAAIMALKVFALVCCADIVT